ncbi:hypothetical protein [Clostridium sp. LIBA-8841]|uniref:hypothetical protein n=1 Tax=Clostridium sp. LIBA-8841 TaxID=2987530 RepID=UPI002AC7DF94|nr:hypothetical protein [Clostridium sp. LIBA-8841]MDZ5253191.1 hypothetical protein [Clostridium sp. LIBA-8841]
MKTLEILDWKFIFIIITFALIGVVCLFKKSKIGLTAASVGIIGSLILWGFFKISIKFKNFLTGVGLSFKDILNFFIAIITAIVAFTAIFLLLKIFNDFGGRLKKR